MAMTEHKTLTAALAAFQAEAPTLPKDATNPHFKSKFTPLDTIVERVGPLLAAHGLAWSTLPTIVDGQPALRYRLAHVSGEELTDTMPLLLDKSNSQGLGSAITYARRYSITAVLNLVADEDDDGNRASTSNGGRAAAQPAPPSLDDTSTEKVLEAIKAAGMPHDWVRMQLVAAGARHVPEGKITLGTIRSLTPEQALALIAVCEEHAAETVKA